MTTQMSAADYRKGAKKAPKYRNKRVVVEGRKFPSVREGTRYQKLRLAQKAGAISDLRLQVTYKLAVNRVHITSYRADFVYVRGGETVVEDSKGMRLPLFKIKAALMKAIYGIIILET